MDEFARGLPPRIGRPRQNPGGRQNSTLPNAYFLSLTAAGLLALAACSSSGVGPQSVQGIAPSGTVEMKQVQAAFIGSGGGGNGDLFFQNHVYPFTVGGLGVGGIGASTIDAHGEVYKLNNVADFPGTYGEARYGFAFGSKSGGDLWLQNQRGVVMHLIAKRTGLMLSLGGDAVIISMKQ